MAQPKPSRRIPWSNVRWLTALLGLALLIFGQLQIAGSIIQVDGPSALGDWLTHTLHLGIPDINNVLLGLPILVLGGAFLAISLRGLYLLPPRSEDFKTDVPVGLRLVRSAWPWLLTGAVILLLLLIQLGGLKYAFYSPILWSLTLLIFAIVAAVWDHRRRVDLSPHLSRRDLLWLIGLLLAGLLIATYRLQGWPDQLMGDEGNFWTIARDIATGTLHPSIFGNGVYSFPILSSVLQAGILKLFGVSLWGWRMASVLPGVITVVPLYLLARDAFNKRVAVVSSIALIASPYFLAFARLGYNNIQALFITVLALYWLYIGLQRSSHFYTFLAGAAVGFGFYTYFGARGSLFIAIAFIGLMWITKKVPRRQALTALGLVGLAFLLVTGPYFVYGMHQDAETMGFKTFESVFFNVFNGRQYYSDAELFKYAPPIHMGGNDLFFNPPIYAALFSQGLTRTLLAFQKPGLITEHYIAFPLAGTVGVFFFLIGLYLSIRNIKEPRNQLLLLWFLTCIIGFSALNTVPPRHTHMVALIPALALLIGLGVNAFMESLGCLHGWFRRHTPVFLGILIATVALGGLYDYFVLAPRQYPPQPDQVMSWTALESHGESLVYVYNDPAQKDFKPYIISEFLPSIRFQAIPAEQALAGKLSLPPAQKAIVFYAPALAGNLGQILQKQWGSAFIQRVFTSPDGIVVLSAGMNTPFSFERDRPFPSTLADAFQHLPSIITIALLLLLLGLAAFLPAPRAAAMPAWLRRAWEWINRPAPAESMPEKSEDILLVPEASIPLIQQPLSAQLPEWVEQLDLATPSATTGRLSGQLKSVKSPEGRDIYLKLHLPPLRWLFAKASKGEAITLAPIHFPNSVLLILAVFLALAGQFAVTRHWFIPAAILYLGGAVSLFFWNRRNPKWMGLFTRQLRLIPRTEWILVAFLFLAIAFTRFYDLSYRVYGLEADESKWTVQSWYSAILHVDQGEFATAHYQYLPVSFWVRSVFLRLFGLNFLSARIESAFLSLLSAVFLYFLIRRLTHSPPTAWLGTALYSFSFMELSASHQALHNTTVEIWMMAGLFLLILALQERKYWQFQIAGMVLAAGMLTYETYFPTPLLAGVFLVGFALYQILKKKDSPIEWIKRALVFFWPIALLFLVYIKGYIDSQAYHFEYFTQANGSGLSTLIQFVLKNGGDYLKTLFSRVVFTDSLISWPGPLINPWLIAFVVIGFVYNLLNLRRPYFLFIPLWFLVNLVYAPLMLGSVWPRVLYTTLGPMAIWGAMGLWTLLAALRAWADGLKLNFAVPVFILLVAAILIKDYSVFTSSLWDPLERQKRRELADLTAQFTASVPLVLFPYEENQNDSVFVESHVLLFSAAGARHAGLDAARYYQALPFEQTLPVLYQDRQLTSVDIFYDKTAESMIDQRSTALQVILHCYPTATLSGHGKFFNVYHLDAKTLARPACYQAPPPAIVSPADGTVVTAPASPLLEWNANGIASTSHAVTVERKVSNNYWIEAEDSFVGPAWSTSSEFVNGFSGQGFLYDNWEAGPAGYTLDIEKAGTYRVWVRAYKRTQNDQINYITVQGKTTEFASNATPLNEWVWEDMGTYTFSAGPTPITLTRTYGEDPEYSVFIDTILVTPDLEASPEKITIWEPVVDSGEIHSTSSRYSLQALPAGEYRWQVRLYDGNRLIDFTGARGVASPPAVFSIQTR